MQRILLDSKKAASQSINQLLPTGLSVAMQKEGTMQRTGWLHREDVMTRHETRECAFYILFEMQFQEETPEALFQIAEEIEELPISDAVKEMVNGVVMHQTELDEIISAYSTKRVLNRIPKINLSILRLALYEIRYDVQMPMNAAISEAISLAKAYGYQEDISFINGVLGNYARDHAEETGVESHV